MPDELNDFETDTHRRVVANLTRPRSATEVAMTLRGPRYHPALPGSAHDWHADEAALTVEGVRRYLSDLERDGLAKNIGRFAHGEEALKAQDADDDVVDYHGVVGEPAVLDDNGKVAQLGDGFLGLASHPARFPILDAEDQYVMTKLAHAKLTGPAWNEADASPDAEGNAFREAMLNLSEGR